MSKEKMARRKAAGDNPNAVKKSDLTFNGAPAPQPMRDTPQGKGNLMNNPKVGQSMGGGAPQPGGPGLFVYDDMAADGSKLGSVGFVSPSTLNQNQVPGTRNNLQAHLSLQKQPTLDTMNMMDALYNTQQTGMRSQKLYGEGQPSSHVPSPMGPLGQSMEAGLSIPGGFPPTFSNQMPSALTPQIQAQAQGMDTKRGGGRDKSKKSA
tara:strand:+ start:1034 stop:1654 length:621 start_codon:yes stop_codon:yes gene_type:complete